jgi:hypothetical protein
MTDKQVTSPEQQKSILDELISRLTNPQYLSLLIVIERQTGETNCVHTGTRPGDLFSLIEAASRNTIGQQSFVEPLAMELNTSQLVKEKLQAVISHVTHAKEDPEIAANLVEIIEKEFGVFQPKAIDILKNRYRQKRQQDEAAKRAVAQLVVPRAPLVDQIGRPLGRN